MSLRRSNIACRWVQCRCCWCSQDQCCVHVQGTDDDVIDIAHGKTLHSLAKRAHPPLWAEGFTHQVESAPPPPPLPLSEQDFPLLPSPNLIDPSR